MSDFATSLYDDVEYVPKKEPGSPEKPASAIPSLNFSGSPKQNNTVPIASGNSATNEGNHAGGSETKRTTSGKIFVGGLKWETTKETLAEYFGQFGTVIDTIIMSDAANGRSRGFGFVTFENYEVAQKVLASSSSRTHSIEGKPVDVKRAVPRDENEKTEKIFVGGIHPDVTESDLGEFFGRFGNVVEVLIMVDRATNRSRGFGFVTFDSQGSVDEALMAQQQGELSLMGKKVEIKPATPKGQGPPPQTAPRAYMPRTRGYEDNQGYSKSRGGNEGYNRSSPYGGGNSRAPYQSSMQGYQYQQQAGNYDYRGASQVGGAGYGQSSYPTSYPYQQQQAQAYAAAYAYTQPQQSYDYSASPYGAAADQSQYRSQYQNPAPGYNPYQQPSGASSLNSTSAPSDPRQQQYPPRDQQ